MSNRATRVALLGPLVVSLGCAGSSSEPSTNTGSSSGSATSQTNPATSSPDDTAPTPSGNGTTTSTSNAGPATFGGPGPQLCPEGVEPALEIGHGEELFRPIDEDAATLVFGPQGGYHIVLGLRAVGLDLSDWGTGHVRGTLDGQVVADHEAVVVMNCDDSGEFSIALWVNLIFSDFVEPRQLLGETISVEAEFIDASNQMVTATADVTVDDTPAG